MRLREFITILEYRRDITATKLGPQLIASAQKDHFFAASTDLSDPAQAADMILAKLEAMDPTRNQQYVQWLARQYIAGQFRLEDRPAVHQTLVDYTKLKPRLPADQRDINRLDYHTTVELVDRILNPQVGLDVEDQGTFPVIKDTEILYNGPLGQLAQPQTEAASCELGSGTKWCTAATESENMYEYYAKHGTLTVWRDRNGERYQFFIPDPEGDVSVNNDIDFEFTDSRNRPIDRDQLNEFRTQHPVLRQWFQQTENRIQRHAEAAVKYARDVIGGRWPGAEPMIIKDARAAMEYARRVIRNRWPEAEPTIIKDAQAAAIYAGEVLQGPWPLAEPDIKADADAAVVYARYVIHGRWPEAEPTIMKNPWAAMEYARHVIRGRWPEAEPYMAQDKLASVVYNRAFLQNR